MWITAAEATLEDATLDDAPSPLVLADGDLDALDAAEPIAASVDAAGSSALGFVAAFALGAAADASEEEAAEDEGDVPPTST